VKVVLFCGGYGMRMRDGVTLAPKPMAMIGHRPLIWHVMRYYAHYGHDDFVLCLGYGAEHVKEYFLRYDETSSNDFVFSEGGGKIELLSTDISNWRITFVNTGLDTAIGERLRRVRRFVADEEMFLANYSDNLTDFQLPKLIDRFHEQNKTAAYLCVRPNLSCHYVSMGERGLVETSRQRPNGPGSDRRLPHHLERQHRFRLRRVRSLKHRRPVAPSAPALPRASALFSIALVRGPSARLPPLGSTTG